MYTYRIDRAILGSSILALLLLAACNVEAAQKRSLDELRTELARNCGQCYGASKDAFVVAARDLERFAAEHPNDLAARRILAQTYNEWSIAYMESDDPQFPVLRRKYHDTYAELVQAMPDDARLLLEYSFATTDVEKQRKALERAAALAPMDTEIEFQLGALYANALKKPDLGFSYMTRAFERETSGRKLQYGKSLISYLSLSGREQQAQSIRQQMNEYDRLHPASVVQDEKH